MDNKAAVVETGGLLKGEMQREMNQTIIRLIPKIPNPEKVTDFRPISLLNVSLKLITKVIANQLRVVLDDVSLPMQASFLQGRSSNDNILLVQEIIHSFKRKKGKVGALALKIYLSKAYDRLSWDFITNILHALQHPSSWISLFMDIISTPEM